MGVYVGGVTLEASCEWHFEEQQWPYADHFPVESKGEHDSQNSVRK